MTNVKDIRVADHRAAAHDVLPLFVQRWSPRAMSGDPVPREELRRLFEAARWAPSAYNEQPWRFLYAPRGSAAWGAFFDALVDANRAWCANAAALIVVLSKKTFSHNGRPNGTHVFDSGAAWASLALQGAAMGLVVHGMAGFDAAKIRASLKVPDDFEVCAMAAVGRPGDIESLPEPLRARELPSPRKPIDEFVFEGTFRA